MEGLQMTEPEDREGEELARAYAKKHSGLDNLKDNRFGRYYRAHLAGRASLRARAEELEIEVARAKRRLEVADECMGILARKKAELEALLAQAAEALAAFPAEGNGMAWVKAHDLLKAIREAGIK